MHRTLISVINFTTKYTPLIIIAIATIAFFAPSLFSWVVSYTQTIILGIIMLTMGLTLTTNDIRILVSRPVDLCIGACAQFCLMPLIAWSLVTIFHLDIALAVGIILVGCCPGGVSSNLMSYLCKGDVAYSVGMTTVSTLLAPVITPALVLLLAGKSIEVEVVGMFINILIVTIIPVTIGFFCNYYFGEKESFKKVQKVVPAISVIFLGCIVGGVVSIIHDDLILGGFAILLWTFFIVFCHNSLGYLAGYMIGKIFKFSTAKKRTISIEVGMQNAGLATNLACTFFVASCPLSVVPCAISCAWHTISGTILASFFSRRDSN